METFLLILQAVFWFLIAPFLVMPLTILLFAVIPTLLLVVVYLLAKFVFKNDPIMILLFSLCSCGFYLIYWNMKMAEVFNAVAGKEVVSTPIAIFAGCCAPANAYFYYVASNEVLPKVSEKFGEKLNE